MKNRNFSISVEYRSDYKKKYIYTTKRFPVEKQPPDFNDFQKLPEVTPLTPLTPLFGGAYTDYRPPYLLTVNM